MDARVHVLGLGLLLSLTASRARAQAATPGDTALTRERDVSLRAMLENAVRDGVNAAIRPWDLILQPLPGGLYRYRGRGFDAVILADGTVRYRSKGPVHLTVMQTLATPGREGLMVAPNQPHAGIALGDVLSEFVEKVVLKNDPHASERKRFLEQTRELREGLVDAAERNQRAKADDELQQQLLRIAYDAERMGSDRAQDALFALWDRCAEDDVGNVARMHIEDFVRAHCALGDPCAFTEQALARLNNERQSKRPFAPYARDQLAK